MLEDVVAQLRCPHCGGGLTLDEAVLVCAARHSFDIARQGYVSLFGGDARVHPGDTAAMVSARASFLSGGHYRPLAEAIAQEAVQTTRGSAAPCVVDLGAGTGHYLARVLDELPGAVGIALDSSKHALRQAARAHVRIGAVGCDIWRGLPLADEAAALMLNVFAPRNGAEIRRVLRPGGTLIVATPTPRHLGELVDAAGLLHVDERKQERLDDKLGPFLTLERQRQLEWELALDAEALAAAVAMGPSSFHARAAPAGPLTVTASLTLSVYQR